MLTCGGLVVALDPAGGQRVRNRVAVLVRYMVSEFVEFSRASNRFRWMSHTIRKVLELPLLNSCLSVIRFRRTSHTIRAVLEFPFLNSCRAFIRFRWTSHTIRKDM